MYWGNIYFNAYILTYSTIFHAYKLIPYYVHIVSMNSDPRIMEVLGLSLGGDAADTPTPPSKPAASTKAEEKKEEKPEEKEVDLSQLSPAERKKKEDQIAAKKCKEKGNELYKSKKFAEALAAYDEAIALDPTNMTYLNNKAAVYIQIRNMMSASKSVSRQLSWVKLTWPPSKIVPRLIHVLPKHIKRRVTLPKLLKCVKSLYWKIMTNPLNA